MQDLVDDAEEGLHKLVQEGHAPSIQFVLRTIGHDRGYITKSAHELSAREPVGCVLVVPAKAAMGEWGEPSEGPEEDVA